MHFPWRSSSDPGRSADKRVRSPHRSRPTFFLWLVPGNAADRLSASQAHATWSHTRPPGRAPTVHLAGHRPDRQAGSVASHLLPACSGRQGRGGVGHLRLARRARTTGSDGHTSWVTCDQAFAVQQPNESPQAVLRGARLLLAAVTRSGPVRRRARARSASTNWRSCRTPSPFRMSAGRSPLGALKSAVPAVPAAGK